MKGGTNSPLFQDESLKYIKMFKSSISSSKTKIKDSGNIIFFDSETFRILKSKSEVLWTAVITDIANVCDILNREYLMKVMVTMTLSKNSDYGLLGFVNEKEDYMSFFSGVLLFKQEPHRNSQISEWLIYFLCTDPSQRRSGIGSKLVNYFLDRHILQDTSKVVFKIKLYAIEESVLYWEKFGFTKSGVQTANGYEMVLNFTLF